MTGSPERDSTQDVVQVSVRIAARPAAVFRFFSDPDRFRQWMGDATFGAVGQPFVVNYPQGSARGVVEEIVQDQRVVFSYGYDDPSRSIPPGASRVVIELSLIDSGTLVTLTHSGLPRDERTGHRMGWRHFLSALANSASVAASVAEPAIEAYQAAWAERDASKRDALLAKCWASGAIFRDAMGYAEGGQELSDYIAAAQQFAPHIRMERVGESMHAHNVVQYRWRMVAPDGTAVMTGSNVGELSPEGKFLSMTGFWEKSATASA